MSRNNNERSLLLAFLKDEPEAVRQFFEEYGGIIRYAVNKGVIAAEFESATFNVIDKNEIFHDTIVHLLKDDKRVLRTFKGKCALTTYLFTICYRCAKRGALNQIKKDRIFEKGLDVSFVKEKELPDLLIGDIGLQNKEEVNALREAILLLPLNDQIFIFMMFYDNRSTEEIRKVFGWENPNSVHVRKKRIIAKCQQIIKKMLKQGDIKRNRFLLEEFPDALIKLVGIRNDEEVDALREAFKLISLDDQIFIQMKLYDNRPNAEIKKVFGFNSPNSVHLKEKEIIAELEQILKNILNSRE
ncbi:MAG: RNA polymerase sigma factor [bacterium]